MTVSIEALFSDDEKNTAQEALVASTASERRAMLSPLMKELESRLAQDNDAYSAAAALLCLRLPEADAAVSALADLPGNRVRNLLPALYTTYAADRTLPSDLATRLLSGAGRARTATLEHLARNPSADMVEPVAKIAEEAPGGEAVFQAFGACARKAPKASKARAHAFFLKALDSEEDETRESALAGIARLGSATPEIVAKLEPMTKVKRPQLRIGAIGALAAVGEDTDARLTTLIALGAKGKGDDAACASVFLAYEIDADLSASALERATSDADPKTRAFAAREAVANPERIERLDLATINRLLADENDAVRAAAAEAAGELTAHKARFVPRLKELLGDTAKGVKRAAKQSLQALDD